MASGELGRGYAMEMRLAANAHQLMMLLMRWHCDSAGCGRRNINSAQPMTYALGIKEVWQLPDDENNVLREVTLRRAGVSMHGGRRLQCVTCMTWKQRAIPCAGRGGAHARLPSVPARHVRRRLRVPDGR